MDRDKKEPIRIELTEEQRKKIQETTGKDAEAVEFQVEELEDRIAPGSILGGGDFSAL
jgi:hypothetical protein